MCKNIYTLDLHDCIYLRDAHAFVRRVEGGWLYEYIKREKVFNSSGEREHDKSHVVFVPYRESFRHG